jgi:hypothetical protein
MDDFSATDRGGYPALWGDFPLPGNEPWVKDFGPLRLWCKTLDGDFWMACVRPDKAALDETPDGKSPESDQWSRWAIAEGYRGLRLSPALPDRSVVVVPESSLVLKPKSLARVFVRCPLWARVELLNNAPFAVTEVPVALLSNTWFGSFTKGELCYWISSAAKRRPAPDPTRPFLAICPIEIRNASSEDLHVERICLRGGELSLFEEGGSLWTDEMRISYRGQDAVSSLKASGKPPPEAPTANPAATPRNPARKRFSAKTFAPLKGLPGFGFIET